MTLHENEEEHALSVLVTSSDIDSDTIDQLADFLATGEGDAKRLARQVKRIKSECDDYTDGNSEKVSRACSTLLGALYK